jgi:hypothetical protein
MEKFLTHDSIEVDKDPKKFLCNIFPSSYQSFNMLHFGDNFEVHYSVYNNGTREVEEISCGSWNCACCKWEINSIILERGKFT